MKNHRKLAALGVILAASAPLALADEINISGPGTFSDGVYTPGVIGPSLSAHDVSAATGICNTLADAAPVSPLLSDAGSNLFSAEGPPVIPNGKDIVHSAQILFAGGVYVNNVPVSVSTTSINSPDPSNVGDDVVAVAPEPSSIALLGTGLLALAGVIRRRLLADEPAEEIARAGDA